MSAKPVMARTILLCDDEVHVVRTLGLKLQRAGYAVATAADGLEAWNLIQRELPDLLITDVFMPRLDGLQLCQRIRGTAATRGLPIFLLTGRGHQIDAGEVLRKWSILDIIAKPFSPRDVVARVNRALETESAVIGHAPLPDGCPAAASPAAP